MTFFTKLVTNRQMYLKSTTPVIQNPAFVTLKRDLPPAKNVTGAKSAPWHSEGLIEITFFHEATWPNLGGHVAFTDMSSVLLCLTDTKRQANRFFVANRRIVLSTCFPNSIRDVETWPAPAEKCRGGKKCPVSLKG